MKSAIASVSLAVGYTLRRGEAANIVLHNVDLDIPSGVSLALIGSNGSGKSTLLRTIAGLLPPLGGELWVLGEKPGRRAAELAMLNQYHAANPIFALCIRDIVRMGRYGRLGLRKAFGQGDEAAVDEAMAHMDLQPLADRPLQELSGGQKQRVYFAQALARQPKILLLDEPANSLDTSSRQAYRTLIRKLSSTGTTILIATHDIEEARSCDLSILLAGRIVALGKSEEVLTPRNLATCFGLIGTIKEGGLVAVESEHGHD